MVEAAIGIEPMNRGFADLCLTTWLRRRDSPDRKKGSGLERPLFRERIDGAGDEIRTRDFHLGKVTLYH
jgi:hypothetical protein